MPRTKSGEKISWKEFGKRWKEGMQNVTPYQQSFIQLIGSGITIIGIIWGILFSILFKQYWLSTILTGALLVNAMQTLGIYQKYTSFKKVEDILKGRDDAG